MGEQKVSLVQNKKQMHKFVRSLLNDVQALEYMLKNDFFETGITRIGAEQEMCMVDKKTYKIAPIAMEALETMQEYEWAETELAKFNLETNLTPREFKGNCLSLLEEENQLKLNKIQAKLDELGADIVLSGILPTLRLSDMEMENLTPKKRYKALMEAINKQMIGTSYELRLSGIDELLLKHMTPFLEACNTSFQVHLQIDPEDFATYYNIAQTLAAPIISIAANSSLVFGKRLWHESRIAMFQQALDTRTTTEHMRQRSPRVSFGNDWLKESVLEIYKEDIARFRVLLSGDVTEDSIKMIKNGEVPKLRALQVHNSTVYRWNRPCYGISENGKPHLRIENRVLAAGPTVVDETANAAFWLGAMVGMVNKYGDITQHIAFEDVRDNFMKASQYGIDTKFTWFNDEKVTVKDLILNELLPIARDGLVSRGIDQADIDKYLGIIEERAKSHSTGARWQLRSFSKLIKTATRDEALTLLTKMIVENQKSGKPVHEWAIPSREDLGEYRPSQLKVEEFMETDLFTVQSDDILELVADMMEWRKIRYTPVEDAKGKLTGLVSSRILLRHFSHNRSLNGTATPKTVSDIMIKNPITVSPNTTIIKAMHTMRDNKIGCLPVVKGDELIGIITEMDFLRIAGRLMESLENK